MSLTRDGVVEHEADEAAHEHAGAEEDGEDLVHHQAAWKS